MGLFDLSREQYLVLADPEWSTYFQYTWKFKYSKETKQFEFKFNVGRVD